MGGSASARLSAAPADFELRHGQMVPLRMKWEPLESSEGADARLSVFVHLLNRSGDQVRTFDHSFPEPSLSGPVEETILLYHSLLAPALPAGDYILAAGLFDGTGRRRALATPRDKEVGRRAYEIARVRIPEGSVEAAVRFSEEWSGPARGTSLQVHTARLLTGPGTLEVEGSTDPASLWLTLGVRAADNADRCVDAEGDSRPELRVRSQCSDVAATRAGCGHHDVEVPLSAGSAGCAIEVMPGSAGGDSEFFDLFTVTLEQLGWAARPDE